ncbi:MAG: nucleotidyltransferase family protein [Terriglobia bacterium]
MPSMPDAMVLCGGAGVRLRSVTGNLPKVMAGVAGRPFLELLLRQLHRHGFGRVILAVGYRREIIRAHFGEQTAGLALVYSVESSPLGTGGALRNAVGLLKADSVLVLNGDSYTGVDLSRFVVEHREANADMSLVVVPTDGRRDCGVVQVDAKGRVERFEEKKSPCGSEYTNAGIYMLTRTLLDDISPEHPVSLEQDLFPQWLERGRRIHAHVFLGKCVDIGTPERFREAQQSLANIEGGKGMTQGETCL